MKKLLLTLLGALALCGLSPHQLQAQDTQEATLDDGTQVTDVARASALTTDLAGKLVRLQFPVQILASGTLKASDNELSIYTRDLEGNAVKLITRMTKTISTSSEKSISSYFPGKAFYGNVPLTNLPELEKMSFCPAGGIVGRLEFKQIKDTKLPLIILRDQPKTEKYFDYCYQGDPKEYTDVFSDVTAGKDFTAGTFISNHRTELSADDYGKYVYITGTCSSAGITPDGASVPIKVQSGTITSYPNSVLNGRGYQETAMKISGKYAVSGIVEYDETNSCFYVMPRTVFEYPSLPVIEKSTTTSGNVKMIGGIIQNETKTEGAADIVLTSTTIKLRVSSTLSAAPLKNAPMQKPYIIWEPAEGYVSPTYIQPSDAITSTSMSRIDCSITDLRPGEDHNIGIRIRIQDCDQLHAPAVASEPYLLTLTDYVSKAQAFTSATEAKKHLADNSDEVTDKYYKIDKDLIVTGFSEETPPLYMMLHDSEGTGNIIAYSKTGWDKKFISGTNSTGVINRAPQLGDLIKGISFTPLKLTSEATVDGLTFNDILVADLSGIEGSERGGVYYYGYIRGHFYSDSDADGDWGDLEYGDPLYKNLVNEIKSKPTTFPISYGDAELATDASKVAFDDSHIADLMSIKSVLIKATGDEQSPDFLTDGLGTDLFITANKPTPEIISAESEDVNGDEPYALYKQMLEAYRAAESEGKDLYLDITGHITRNCDATTASEKPYAMILTSLAPTVEIPMPEIKVMADGIETEVIAPDADAPERRTASFLRKTSVRCTDAEAENVDYEILMSIDGKEFGPYDAQQLSDITKSSTIVFKCPMRPGYLPGGKSTTLALVKRASDVNSLAGIVSGNNSEGLYHMHGYLMTLLTANGKILAADKNRDLTIISDMSESVEPESYITDMILVKDAKGGLSLHESEAAPDQIEEKNVAETDRIVKPEPITLFGAVIADGKAIENEGQGASYAIDPTFKAIPTAEAEGWKLTGYILPGADSKPVIYLTAAEAVDRVALPVITPAEAAFLDKTTVTVTCATTGAAIEYSTDGGKTWNAYSEPFDVEATGDILARATAADMLPSRQAKASVVREYLSGDVTITVDEQNGKTVITITGPGKIYYSIDGGAEKQYDGTITIANDTQTELAGTISAYALEEGKRPGAAKEASYKVSGISGIGADAEADGVRVEGNTITVPEGAQTFDIAGRRVNPQGLSRGIYIVRLASGKAVKVVIK